MSGDILTIGAVLLGVWVLVGAAVLTLAPNIGLRAREEWASPENVFILFSDYLLGGWLLYAQFAIESRLASCLLLGALGLTHTFRCAQTILGLPRPFCVNRPAMLMNLAKLSLALSLWGVCVGSR